MRKTKEDTQVTKNQILQGAFECFASKGYDWTTIDRVAEQVGLSRGTIYWHFADKRALYLATVEYGIACCDMVAHAKELPEELPLEERLDEIFLRMIQEEQCIRFQYKALAFSSDKEEFQDIVDKIVAMRRRIYQFFREQCERQIQQHHLTGMDPVFFADALILMMEGMFMVENLNLPISLSGEWIKMHVRAIIAPLLVNEEEQL